MSKKATLALSVIFLAISSLLIAATYTTPNLQLNEKKPPQTSSTIALNSRSESKYVGRQVFIVSDKDWRDVIGLVPVAMWKEGGGLKKYPVLVWHEEEGGFDADSVIFFIEQYKPGSIVIVGDTPEELDNLLIAAGYTFRDEIKGRIETPLLQPTTGSDVRPIGRTDTGSATGTIGPSRVNLLFKWITRISPDDYAKFWESLGAAVVCERDYHSCMLASVYAAYINAPLFFEGKVNPADLAGKRIITVGNNPIALTISGAEHYTRDALEKKLLELYPTDKVILINRSDLIISEPKWTRPFDHFATLLSGDELNEFYSKTSLLAPFLAVAKNEIILASTYKDYRDVDPILEGKIASLGLKPKYLTIMASPIAIQMRKPIEEWPEQYEEVDNHIYGDIDGDGYQNLAVGRIMGLTPSDVSAYVARDIFIEELKKNKNFASLWPPAFLNLKIDGLSSDRAMKKAGFIDNSIYINNPFEEMFYPVRDLQDKILVGYLDHGIPAGWDRLHSENLREAMVKLDPSIVISNACNTCAYPEEAACRTCASNPEGPTCDNCFPPVELFCSNIIKHGAMAHIGAVNPEPINEIHKNNIIINELLRGKDIGQAFLKFKNAWQAYNMYTNRKTDTLTTLYDRYDIEDKGFCLVEYGVSPPYETYFILLGDPTLKIIATPPLPDEAVFTIADDGDTKNVRFHISQPAEENRIVCGGVGPRDDCLEGTYDFYLLPSSQFIVGGTKQVRGAPVIPEDHRYPGRVGGGFTEEMLRMMDIINILSNPYMHDLVYWEIGGISGISGIEFKMRYSDGTEKLIPLEKIGDVYFGRNEFLCANISASKVGDNMRFFMDVREVYLDPGKITPAYEYDINIKKTVIYAPSRIH